MKNKKNKKSKKMKKKHGMRRVREKETDFENNNARLK